MKETFEYNANEGGKWWIKPVPALEPWVQAELNLIAGYSDRGQPKLRCVWGGSQMHDITARPQLKYQRTIEICTGYNYVKEDGSIGYTLSMNLPDDATVPWEFHPKMEQKALGRLRWIIERHVPAHELRKLGRFQHRKGVDGTIVLRELPSEGVYDHFFTVQTAAGKYRDVDREVVTAIEAMWLYDISTSAAQKVLDNHEHEQQNILVGVKESMAAIANI